MQIEKIPKKILGAVRQRLGADNEDDKLFDLEISVMSPREVVVKYVGWHLGSEDWGYEIINRYDELKKIEIQTPSSSDSTQKEEENEI